MQPSHHIADLRPTLAYFGIAVLSLTLGAAIRFLLLGLPFLVVRYGGSALWAVMIYFLVAAFMPHGKAIIPAAIAIAFTNLLEFSRLYHRPSLEAFRLSLAGALLLGRVFDRWHLLVYTVSIIFAAVADQVLVRRLFRERGRSRVRGSISSK